VSCSSDSLKNCMVPPAERKSSLSCSSIPLERTNQFFLSRCRATVHMTCSCMCSDGSCSNSIIAKGPGTACCKFWLLLIYAGLGLAGFTCTILGLWIASGLCFAIVCLCMGLFALLTDKYHCDKEIELWDNKLQAKQKDKHISKVRRLLDDGTLLPLDIVHIIVSYACCLPYSAKLDMIITFSNARRNNS
jgi:hypothetical protein